MDSGAKIALFDLQTKFLERQKKINIQGKQANLLFCLLALCLLLVRFVALNLKTDEPQRRNPS